MRSSSKTRILLMIISGIFFFALSCKERSPRVILTTTDVTAITQTSAVSGGYISPGIRATITAKGVCWAQAADPTPADNFTSDGAGDGSYISNLKGLQPGTEYYFRAYAIAGKDTIYGRNIAFTTMDYETITDIDGNVYRNILIGRQTWMAENLRTVHFNDGTSIPLVRNDVSWAGLTTPGFCYYKNDEEAFKPTYGALYNWYAVNTGKLCPAGWHVPDDKEWSQLTDFLGGESIAGGKLKEAGSTYWVEPNSGANNESGFSSYPGGFRFSDGKFFDFGFSSYFWVSGEYSETRAFFRFLYYDDTNVYRFDNEKKNGFSVRCIKD